LVISNVFRNLSTRNSITVAGKVLSLQNATLHTSTRLRTVKKAAHKTRVLTQELSSRLAFLMNGLRQVQVRDSPL